MVEQPVGSFLLAILVAPPVVIVGLLGRLVSGWRQRRRIEVAPENDSS